MKAIVLVATLLVATLSGAALASQGPDDSATRIDLSQAGGPIVYVMCAHATSLANCQSPTLWEESNGLGNLQHVHIVTQNQRWDPDSEVLS